jgi:GNAT superfamily N-acetyltransferase
MNHTCMVAPGNLENRFSAEPSIGKPAGVLSIDWLEDPSPRQVEAVAAMVSEFYREFLPNEPDLPAAELAATSQCEEDRLVAIAVAGDETGAAGAARVIFRDVKGRQDIGEVDPFVVRAGRRRHGVGTALLAAVSERARQEGRARLEYFVVTAHVAGMEFAATTGAHPGLLDEQNRVPTDRIDAGLMKQWVTESEQMAQGYSLVCLDGVCPDEWLERLSRISHVMNTAPRSDDREDVIWTAEQMRAHQKALIARGWWSWNLAVLHEASGELVGYTELGGSPHQPWLAQQGDTAVEPAHRGRGLAKWMKATTALRLLGERPEATVIETANAGVNAPMLAINHAMGFSWAAEWQEWTLRI